LYLALFFLTQYWTNHTPVGVGFLFLLGFLTMSFTSADYFPILPWFFLFLLGSWMGGFLVEWRRTRQWKVFDVSVPRALTWPGRHSLLIYMLHQPILYGLVWLIVR